MRRIICYSLWGDNPQYWQGMLRNLELTPKIYPGWDVVIYAHHDVPELDKMEAAGAELRMMPYYRGHSGSFWRFLAADKMKIGDLVIFRDADSDLNIREKAAVDAWLAGTKPLHIMRDHPLHAPTPMLAGMWGMWGAAWAFLGSIGEKIARYSDVSSFGQDQRFLSTEIWPVMKRSACVHTSCPEPLGGDPFPWHPRYDGFVGEAMIADEQGMARPLLPDHRQMWWDSIHGTVTHKYTFPEGME